MYRGFQLQLDTLNLDAYKENGQKIYDRHSRNLKPILDGYILANGALDGAKMEAEWFPQMPADIFISHSHDDKELAISLTGWLYDCFRIVAFIDSCIWGYADDLLEIIDNQYCRNDNNVNFNYTKRNRSTTHVHMMLSTALSKMIDHSECLFFLRTPKSTIKNIVHTKTYSPWIYSEIATSQIVRKRFPDRVLTTEIMKAYSGGGVLNESQKEELRVEYLLKLNHLVELTDRDLRAWNTRWNSLEESHTHPLDKLYHIKPVK